MHDYCAPFWPILVQHGPPISVWSTDSDLKFRFVLKLQKIKKSSKNRHDSAYFVGENFTEKNICFVDDSS